MIKSCGAGIIYSEFGLRGQEYHHHDIYQVFGLHQRLLSINSTAKLSKHIDINNHSIGLVYD